MTLVIMPRLLCCYQCDIRIQNAMFSSVEPVEIPLLQMTSESKTSTNSKGTLTKKKLKKHQVQIKCLGGQLSLQQSVRLIVFIEVFFSLVLLVQSIDLIDKDGNYFYFLHNFDGFGIVFFAMHVSVCALCLLTSFVLLIGISKKCRWLLVPHLIWQISFASLSFLICLIILRLGWRGRMLMPASIVLTVMISVPDEPTDFTSIAFPAYRQVPVTEKIAEDLCGDGTESGTRNSTNASTHRSSTDL
ncbi:hypothetical protein PRIPAC_74988 [Pristionchus pacificus]|uniref:Uncharacterized protein n=1 Tax=Pristionchus pacificus TaxID=54126 RepID=A0A2A6BZT8_PRIPA|nr:hypothetical protein PRIPAC_74988 [Pristionchus pacificus]|eukprot:PDM71454.1 hypothetical protein PRIPAC_37861 [Pristionchus pacificus]